VLDDAGLRATAEAVNVSPVPAPCCARNRTRAAACISAQWGKSGNAGEDPHRGISPAGAMRRVAAGLLSQGAAAEGRASPTPPEFPARDQRQRPIRFSGPSRVFSPSWHAATSGDFVFRQRRSASSPIGRGFARSKLRSPICRLVVLRLKEKLGPDPLAVPARLPLRRVAVSEGVLRPLARDT